MPRQSRLVVPGQSLHVIQRGHNRSPVFFDEDDYGIYLRCLSEASRTHRCDIHAYVLMTNHVHLLLTPSDHDSVAKVMQSVGRRFVQYINSRYGRTGTLWDGRYKSTLIHSDRYLLKCSHYIELNPVRAGIVIHPGAYKWSSYQSNANGLPDQLLVAHPVYLALGETPSVRQQNYRSLAEDNLDDATLETIRNATNKGWPLGDEKFKNNLEAALKRRLRPLPRGGQRPKAGRPPKLEEIKII